MVIWLCLQICLIRILDVSLGTVRTILTVRGKRIPASLVGFFEAFLWFVVVRNALNSDVNVYLMALSYSSGFALGTFLGGVISDIFFSGILDLQIITSSRNDELIAKIREEGFAVSVLNVNSSQYGDEKYMLIMEIHGKMRKKVEHIVRELDPSAFIMVRETRAVRNGFLKWK